jgi:aspartate-semialdehyde dehydrogenase
VPVEKLRLAASSRSAGKIIDTPFGKITVEEISEKIFEESDIALFVASSEISLEWAPKAAGQNCVVIDNSSAFRYEPGVPLIIPEINPQEIKSHHGIIANPNCTTAIAAIPLWEIEKHYRLQKVFISTYQAASGAGREAMAELEQQTKNYAAGKNLKIENFQYQILFNIIPHIDKFQDNGYTKEEMKVVWEMRKIFGLPELAISCTAVRVPIMRAHSESIVVETKEKIDPEEIKKIFSKTHGIVLVDDPENNIYPMPINASGKYDVEVGRIRQNLVFGENGLEFFVSGDQILKGAALNAVQIAELLVKK